MFIYFVLALILLVLPDLLSKHISKSMGWITRKMRNFIAMPNTLIHELSHLLTAYLTGGRGHAIKLNEDLSGVAITSNRFRLGEILMLLAGYIGASFISYLLTDFYVHEQLTLLITLLLILFTIAALFIRNIYGFLWIASVAIMVYSFSPFSDWSSLDLTAYAQPILLFLIAVCSVESWFSAWRVMRLAFTHPQEKSDATDLQEITKIPASVWGVIFFASATFFIGLQLNLILN